MFWLYNSRLDVWDNVLYIADMRTCYLACKVDENIENGFCDCDRMILDLQRVLLNICSKNRTFLARKHWALYTVQASCFSVPWSAAISPEETVLSFVHSYHWI